MTSNLDTDLRQYAAKVAACRFNALESQAVFKLMLEALSRPGLIGHFPSEIQHRLPCVLAPVIVLADVETRIHIAQTSQFNWESALISATGARPSVISTADLIAIPLEAAELISQVLESAPRGTALAPEYGARVIIGVRRIYSDEVEPTINESSHGLKLRLSGPGIKDERIVWVDGISLQDFQTLQRSNAHFPSGIDVWMTTDNGQILGLPRSTQILVEEYSSKQEAY